MISLEGLPTVSSYAGVQLLDMRELKVGTILTSEDGLTKLKVILHPFRALGIRTPNYCVACEISRSYTGWSVDITCVSFLDNVMGITNRTSCSLIQGVPRVFAIEGEVDYGRYKQFYGRDDV